MVDSIERRYGSWLVPALSLAAFVLVAASLRHGMPISADGWFFWEGSVSLLEGLGLRSFDGETIRYWPPLYPVYLAAVQAVLDVSARSLALSTAMVTGIAVLAWSGLIRWYAVRRGDTSRVALAVAWVTVLLVLNARDLRAENLERALLPVLVWATLRGATAATVREHLTSAGAAALVLSALLATRNASIALLPGVAVAFGLWSGGGRAVQAFAVAVATGVPIATWLLLRTALDQLGSHDAGLGAGTYDPFTYLVQLVRGVDRSTNLDFVGLPLLIVLGLAMLRSDVQPPDGLRREGTALLLFVGVSLLAMIGLLSVTEVADRLRGRFTVWVPLTVGALGIVDSRRLLTRHAALIFFVVLFAQPTLRTAKHAVRGRGDRQADYGVVSLRQFVPAAATIEPGYVRLPPRDTGRRVLVSPPHPEPCSDPPSRSGG